MLALLLAAPAAWAAYGSNNTRTVDSPVDSWVYGGRSDTAIAGHTGIANNNTLTITSTGSAQGAYGGVAISSGGAATASGNTLTIWGEVHDYPYPNIYEYAAGGRAEGNASSAANNNTLIVKPGATVNTNAYGGDSGGSATENIVEIEGVVTGKVRGGFGSRGDATKNTVTITGVEVGGSVYGGEAGGSATKNTVTIANSTVNGDVYGGDGGGGAGGSENTVTITDSVVSSGVFGGNGGSATKNSVTISNSTVKFVLGGVTNSTVTITGGEVTGYVNGGTGRNNTVTITGVEVGGSVYGSYYNSSSSSAKRESSVTLAGSTKVGGDVFGGYKDKASRGAADFTIQNKLYVQDRVSVDGSVGNFEILDFTLPAGFAKGDVMLTVGGDATFRSDEVTGVRLSFAGTPPALNVGDSITLIAATGAMTIKRPPDEERPFVDAGGYVFKVEQVGNSLVATVLPPHTYYTSIYPSWMGSISCVPERVADGGEMTCTAKVDDDRCVYDDGSIYLSHGSVTKAECSGATCKLYGITSDVTLGASFKLLHKITSAATPAGGGAITCTPNPALYSEHDPVICTATANAGFVYVDGSLKLDSGYAEASCSGNKCELLRIESDLVMSAEFTPVGGGGGGGGGGSCGADTLDPNTCPGGDANNSSPAMGDIGLLLAGLALAGAAAPALRRRERKSRV